MKLRTLLKGIADLRVKGSQDISITGISSHSKLVAPGYLFIARKGSTFDGSDYIQEAINAGASAILTDMYNPFLAHVTQIVHPQPHLMEGVFASRYYQSPSEELFVVGVTGTNGKTTTAYWIQHLLHALKGPCGMIGSIEYQVGEQRYQATRTTPDVVTNHRLLRDMVLAQCSSAVMEVTSHALDQGRTEGICFDVAVFTNLTQDHLDYHQTMERYADAKKRLFLSLQAWKKKIAVCPYAIMNADSPAAQQMVVGCCVPIFTYGSEKPADLRAEVVEMNASFSVLILEHEGKKERVRLPVVGSFNASNALAALSVVLSQGYALEAVVGQLQMLPSVPGRMQPVENCLGRQIFVDYAHTPDSLEKTLRCIREITEGRLFLVFGCGGQRDRQKRPMMAQVSERLADQIILTNDNPRNENSAQILQEVIQGFSSSQKYLIEPDRRKAIEIAIDKMQPGDCLLLAGKGHETTQVFAHHTVEFSDVVVAQDLCREFAKKRSDTPISTL